MSNFFKKQLVIYLISILLPLCFHSFISRKIELVAHCNGNLKIQDYAYHIIITKAFWFDGFGDIYKLSFQQHALSAYIGSPIYTVMPLGITPVALLVWLPFAFVSCYSMALSYTLWITLSLFILFTAFWSIVRNSSQNKIRPILPITLSFVTIFSSTTFRALHLGQTSVLASGLLIHLICFVHKTANQSKSNSWLLITIIIFILGTKPTYVALALGLLIIYGMWRQAIYSTLTVFVLLMGITPFLTLEWVPSYLSLLQMYNHGNFPEFYAWAIAPETMNIFRSAFGKFIGDNLAALISCIVTCCTFIGVVGFSIFAKIRGDYTDQFSPVRTTEEQLFILLVAGYLLFSPYAGAYEDILFLPVFFTVLLFGKTPKLTDYKSLLLIFSLFVILLQSYFPPNKPLWLFWILKFIILSYMVYFCRFSSEKNNFLPA
jgi:hypothetical protein